MDSSDEDGESWGAWKADEDRRYRGHDDEAVGMMTKEAAGMLRTGMITKEAG